MDPEELRLVVAVPVAEEPADRVVRVFWSTLPAERVVEEPVERLVVAELELPVERLVVAELELPVDRVVRVFWLAVPAERVLEEPEERLTEELLPEERLVWLCTEAERDGAAAAEALP